MRIGDVTIDCIRAHRVNEHMNIGDLFMHAILRENSSAISLSCVLADLLAIRQADSPEVPMQDEVVVTVLSGASPIHTDVCSLPPL
jgi:hypothetical protein